MGKSIYTYNNYQSILENNIKCGNMFIEKIKDQDENDLYTYCIFSTFSEQDYIFWKQHPQGNIYININLDKRDYFGKNKILCIPGFITFIGKSLCEAHNSGISLSEYFSKIIH